MFRLNSLKIFTYFTNKSTKKHSADLTSYLYQVKDFLNKSKRIIIKHITTYIKKAS